VLGGILLASGGLWLLSSLDVIDISLTAVLPVALILVGLALVIGSRTGRHSGLVLAGVILTVMLAFASTFDIRLEGGVGERNYAPTSVVDLKRDYRLALGEMRLDLSGLQLPATRGGSIRIDASVGMGQLVVRVPQGFTYIVHATAGAGQVVLFGRESNGIDAELSIARRGITTTLVLELSVGLGQVDVDG
jgi:hypothetical protein